ncbi:MAG: hypothetical protein WCH34_03045 [Bacteroidota bacterium]
MQIDTNRLLSPQKLERIVFIVVVLILLLPLWLNKFFITQDGPAHIYNAKVLLDHLFSHDVAFYNQYYTTNFILFPYWFGHIAISLLLFVFSPTLIEKIFLSFYIIAFALSFRFLIRSINPNSTFISLLVLPLISNYAFQMGFYNYIFSIVFMFITIRYWLKYQGLISFKIMIVLLLLLLLLYFTHAIIFSFTLVAIAIYIAFSFLVRLLNDYKNASKHLTVALYEIIKFIAVAIPSLLLLFVFMSSSPNYMNVTNGDSIFFMKNFLKMTYLILLTDKETVFSYLMAIFLFIMLGFAIFYKFKNLKLKEHDAFYLIVFVLLIFHLYFSQHTIGYFERTQLIPWMFLIVWMATLDYHKWIHSAVLIATFVMVVGQTIFRAPVYAKSSEVFGDYVSIEPQITANSTVLPLVFSNNGIYKDRQLISDKLYLYANASNLIGAFKPIIVMTNIPALYNQFPYIWKQEMNPWTFIGNLHFEPPEANFVDYRKKTTGDIDYVVTWFADNRYSGNAASLLIMEQLQNEYQLIYTSPLGFAKLYKHLPPSQRKVKTQADILPNTDKATELLNQSVNSYNQGDYNECIRLNKQALDLKPEMADAWNNICASYNSMKMWKDATKACNEALRIRPDYQLAKNNLDWALKNLK